MGWKIVNERLGRKAGRYSTSSNYFLYTAVYFININSIILKINKYKCNKILSQEFSTQLISNKLKYEINEYMASQFKDLFNNYAESGSKATHTSSCQSKKRKTWTCRKGCRTCNGPISNTSVGETSSLKQK